MKKNKIIALTLFALSSIIGHSQTHDLEKAEKKYTDFAYVKASDIYERLIKKGYHSPEIIKKIANSLYFQAKFIEATKWYAELFANTSSEIETESYLRYAHCLKASGDFKKADDILVLLSKIKSTDSRIKAFETHKNYKEIITKNSNRYAIENIAINSKNSDFGATLLDNKLVFTSNRSTNKNLEHIDSWTNQPFTDIYYCTIENGSLVDPKQFSSAINTIVNESTPIFTLDGKTMYFTRNNYNKDKFKPNQNEKILLKIYKAVHNGTEWTNIEELPFNSNAYSCAHPSLSVDGKKLYFSSDMPGTIGQSDLFYCDINADGTYGKPINLGPTINTEGRETYPFISADNELYFASDGHLGLGGLDIFVSKYYGKNYLEPVNVGAPVNGNFDDFAFIIDSKSKIGFVTSNRPENSKGFDDIYKLKELKPLLFETTIQGQIVCEDSKIESEKQINKSNLILLDKYYNIIAETKTNDSGNYTFEHLKTNEEYFLRIEHEGYVTQEIPITTDISPKPLDPITIKKELKKVTVGNDLKNISEINNVLYDVNSWKIRPDAEITLIKIHEVLVAFPKMSIAIHSYADSRASDQYNLILSEKRALETKQWLIAQGINSERITAKGYGETNLVNHCKDGVPCSEKEHEKNRRSEFIITGL